ncbi:dis3 exonuclease 1 [Echinococcus multilocularis]|uniref:DIS3-like exonuclease 1 n=1 Tax=Echinococcus multilocularis TaxID=6211 RepID=A0A068Y095_ECHMU|nr:dis3 exonuclease 1 [Echinococcus multilocularis]
MSASEGYAISRVKSEKVVTYVTPQGKSVRVTREVYLRKNVPCRTQSCPNNECHLGFSLPSDLENIVIVDGFYALYFWEVFESVGIRGIVVTLSSLCYTQQQSSSRAVYNRIRACLSDPVQCCVLFDNEFHEDCFRQSYPGESTLDYTTRLNWTAAQWYQSHLMGKVNVIFLTNKTEVALELARRNPSKVGVLVMDLATYLQTHHPNLTTVRQLYDSLCASLKSSQSVQNESASTIAAATTTSSLPQQPAYGDVYPAHLPESALIAGVRSGQFLQGVLRVSRFRSSTEAVVVLTDASALKHQADTQDTEFASRSELAINGMAHRNRAVDGDIVVVRLLPRHLWTMVSSNLMPSEAGIAEAMVSGLDNAVAADESGEAESKVGGVGGDITAQPVPTSGLPCAFVVGVLTRNWRDYVCSYVPREMQEDKSASLSSTAGWIVATPWDRRIPRVRIFTTEPSKLAGIRFVVRMDRWDANSNYPSGHFVQSLGPIGDLETETQTILVEHGLAYRPFTDVQLDELKHLAAARGAWQVDPMEVARRRDLRTPSVSGNPLSEDTLVFSIDPPGCEDVDDALSVRWLGSEVEDVSNRRIQLGVHIADVTHFVKPNRNLDAEARRRSTSVYLADRRYDMLPGILSGDVCSLWSGVDRYAVSVIWELDPVSLEVLDVWYGRTVIRSAYKMTYQAAQTIADLKNVGTEVEPDAEKIFSGLGGLKDIGELVPELANKSKAEVLPRLARLYSAICMLVRIASQIRHLRVDRGGLELDSVEVSVKFENPKERTGALEDIVPKETLEMHSTVAEIMIFANHWVARQCLKFFPERSCLRRHPPPRPEFFDDLKRCAASRGFRLEVGSNKALSASLAMCVDPMDPEVNSMLRQLATRAMTNALYFSTGSEELTRDLFGHYGLALNLYTHFTSPIRRYADIIVHRVLLAAVEQSTTVTDTPTSPKGLYEHDELVVICRHMNERHWAAQQAQRSSIELFQALFFRDKPVDDACRYADAVIYQLRGSNGFSVMVPRYGLRGNVCLKQADGRIAWVSDAKTGRIIWLPADEPCEIVRSPISTQMGPHGLPPCDQLEVVKPNGARQSYRIFDHVTVYITIAESTAHSLGLRLELYAKEPKGRKKGKVNQPQPIIAGDDGFKMHADAEMVESVRAMNVEKRRKRKKEGESEGGRMEEGDFDEPEKVNEQKAVIAQLHTPSSFYHQFRKLLRQGGAGCEGSDSIA